MAYSMDYENQKNLPSLFFEQADRLGNKPFLWAKREGHYLDWTWAQTQKRALNLAAALKARGIGPGDRVVLVSENRPKWVIADIAIMAIGAITVPAYTTNSQNDHLYIMDNSAAKAVIVSTSQLAQEVLPAASHAPSVEFAICIDTPKDQEWKNLQVLGWEDLQQESADLDKQEILDLCSQRQRQDTACIIYTSGTGGAPKGVMLSHGAIIKNCEGAFEMLKEIGLREQTFLSFLPLSHSYEHTAGLWFPISIGAEIYYAEGIETLSQNLKEARPTIMTAVPRLYEVMLQKIKLGLKKKSALAQAMFERAVELGTKKFNDPNSLTVKESAENFMLDMLVRKKVKESFGGQLKCLVSGGAPLNHEVGMFFTSLGLRLCQGYGQTESAPVISCNKPKSRKIHTVGPPLKDVQVKIADDGEILVKGELVMQGYWAEPELSKKTIVNNWLHTGDIGHMDEDGHIVITDRKKDIIVNAGGDNISPQRVEGFLTLETEIAQAMVYGDKQPHLVALIVPDADWAKGWAKQHDKKQNLEGLVDDADFRNEVFAAIERVNQRLSAIEKVRRFIMTAEAFTIDNEQMTPTMKIRRHKIKEIYGDALTALYEKKLKATG